MINICAGFIVPILVAFGKKQEVQLFLVEIGITFLSPKVLIHF